MEQGSGPCFPVGISLPRNAVGIGLPDGKYFVFQATRNNKTEIWALREGRGVFGWHTDRRGKPVQLTGGQLNSLAPVFSPDGKRLYVIGQQLRGELERYDTRSGEWAPYLSGISADFVDFSRDGQWITYVSFPDQILWRSRIDGSERLQLTRPPMEVLQPSWSPDGGRIAFVEMSPGSLSGSTSFPLPGGSLSRCSRSSIIRGTPLGLRTASRWPSVMSTSSKQLDVES